MSENTSSTPSLAKQFLFVLVFIIVFGLDAIYYAYKRDTAGDGGQSTSVVGKWDNSIETVEFFADGTLKFLGKGSGAVLGGNQRDVLQRASRSLSGGTAIPFTGTYRLVDKDHIALLTSGFGGSRTTIFEVSDNQLTLNAGGPAEIVYRRIK